MQRKLNKQNGYNNFTTLLYFSYSNHFVYFSSPPPLGSVCHLYFAFRTLPGVGLLLIQIIHTTFSTSPSLGTKGFADCNQRRFRFFKRLKGWEICRISNARANPHADFTASRQRKVVRINCSVMPLKSCTRRCLLSARLFLYSISTQFPRLMLIFFRWNHRIKAVCSRRDPGKE